MNSFKRDGEGSFRFPGKSRALRAAHIAASKSSPQQGEPFHPFSSLVNWDGSQRGGT
jgi:hypothetical protein